MIEKMDGPVDLPTCCEDNPDGLPVRHHVEADGTGPLRCIWCDGSAPAAVVAYADQALAEISAEYDRTGEPIERLDVIRIGKIKDNG